MMTAYDWRVDPDGRDCEDRKNGPVTSYKLTPEEIEKYKKGEKTMTESVANYEVKETEKKRMTKELVIEMTGKGMTENEIAEYFGYTDGKAKILAKARIAKHLKPEEPKVEPVEDEHEKEDFWEGVRHELMGLRESEIDKVNEDFLKVLARWIGGDHSEETTASLMFLGEKVLNI